MADSLYNIRLLREFSNEHLNKCFYLTLEDMLYAPLVLKVKLPSDMCLKPTAFEQVFTVSGLLCFVLAERYGFYC